MMKNVYSFYIWLTLFVIIIITTAFKANYTAFAEKIEWNTHFNAKPDDYSPYAALTATTWQYSYITKIRDNQLNIDFKFVGGVDPNKSWVKRNRIKNKEISNQLLNHEQGHVYINFLLLKEGELRVRNQNYTINNYKKLIQLTANKISKQYSDMQSRYDNETKHGSDLFAQKQWDDYLKKQLDSYEK